MVTVLFLLDTYRAQTSSPVSMEVTPIRSENEYHRKGLGISDLMGYSAVPSAYLRKDTCRKTLQNVKAVLENKDLLERAEIASPDALKDLKKKCIAYFDSVTETYCFDEVGSESSETTEGLCSDIARIINKMLTGKSRSSTPTIPKTVS
ncbi:MAG TPA: hypothetical protein VN457_01835 [Chlamydiales bacterium]|nr:hypothetical protein [Chlamydiales bacterium]